MGVTQHGPGFPDRRAARADDVPSAPVHDGPDRITVEVGELVLDGFAHLDRDRVAAAFDRELTRLLYERGMPAGADLSLDVVGDLPALSPGPSSRQLGEVLARRVHAGLSQREPREESRGEETR